MEMTGNCMYVCIYIYTIAQMHSSIPKIHLEAPHSPFGRRITAYAFNTGHLVQSNIWKT